MKVITVTDQVTTLILLIRPTKSTKKQDIICESQFMKILEKILMFIIGATYPPGATIGEKSQIPLLHTGFP